MYELPQLTANLTRPQVLLALQVLNSWKQRHPDPMKFATLSVIEDIFRPTGRSRHLYFEAAGLLRLMVLLCKFINNSFHCKSSVSQHALRRGGVSPRGGVCPGVSASGPGGVSAQGGVWPLVPGGVCLWSWGGVSQHAMGQTPPRGQTDTCENITFANFVCGR